MPSLLSLLLAVATVVPLSGCKKEPESPPAKGQNQANHQAKPAASPQAISEGSGSHYREDEKILLRLATTDILELERKKAYGKIYDDYASQNFKKNVSRRDFLRMGNCLELTMGDLVDYQRDQWIFNRKTDSHGVYDNTVRSVVRSSGNLKEQITYVLEGVDFKLNAIYWSSNRKDFLTCMKKVTQTMTRPSARPQTPAGNKPAAPNTTASPKPDAAPTAGVAPLPDTKPVLPPTKSTEPKASSAVKKAPAAPAAPKKIEPAKPEVLPTPPEPTPPPDTPPAKAPEPTDTPQ